MASLVPEAQGLCVPVRQVVAFFDFPKDLGHFRKESFPGAATTWAEVGTARCGGWGLARWVWDGGL